MTAAHEPWRIGRGEPGYPPGLEELERPPRALWGVGAREAVWGLDARSAVTVVGSRRSGSYGCGVARGLGAELGEAGLTVVSGMALGCDSAAHEGALRAGATTVAVLGGGPDVAYPASKAALHRAIAARGGAAVSEHQPGTRPERWSFPERNRIMAALSSLTVVVEGAGASGTRITADEALRLGREVGAVPGSVNSSLSELPHELIRDGALLVRGGADVIELLLGVGALVRRTGPPLEGAPAAALQALDAGATTCDAVALAAGLEGGDAAIALARLELMGYVRADATGRLGRTALAAPAERR